MSKQCLILANGKGKSFPQESIPVGCIPQVTHCIYLSRYLPMSALDGWACTARPSSEQILTGLQS